MKNLSGSKSPKKRGESRKRKRAHTKKNQNGQTQSGRNASKKAKARAKSGQDGTEQMIPKEARNILNTLESAGYEAWCVGGCVRDTLLNHVPKDWDVTTNATPEEIQALFRTRAIPTGLKHGTLTIRSGVSGGIEVTTYRIDGEYTDHRRPDSVEFTSSLEEDLRRRDFTVNAIALNLSGEIRDPYHGQDDLRSGVLRCVNDPDRRFNEDALRILRGLRFAAVLSRTVDTRITESNQPEKDPTGVQQLRVVIKKTKNIKKIMPFEIEPETAAAMHRNCNLLLEIAPERIWLEISKMMRGDYTVSVLRQFPDVIGVFWPEILPMIHFDQRNKHHCYDVWEHTLHALEALYTFETPFRNDMALRFALLLHDIGKPATCTTAPDGQRHFYGHPAKSREIAEGMLRKLRCPNLFREQVLNLIEQHDQPIPTTERETRRLLAKMEVEDIQRLFDLKRADNLAQSPEYRERQAQLNNAQILLREVQDRLNCFSLKQLAVNGRDMQKLKIYGPAVGSALRILLERVIDGDLPNDHDALVKFARENLR